MSDVPQSTPDGQTVTARPTMQRRWRVTHPWGGPPIKVLEQAWEIVEIKDDKPYVLTVEWREVPHVCE